MESELERLAVQREKYLLAARSCGSRQVALRRLLTVERLNMHIECLQEALATFDDCTTPIAIEQSESRRIGLGPITPPAF
jgi:hypothetical protein